MAQEAPKMSVEQMQKALLDAEKSGRFSWEELGPLWEQAKESIETEQQAVALYTTFIYLTRRYQDRDAVKNGANADYSRVEELFQEASDFLAESFEEEYSAASMQLEKNFAYFCYTKTKKLEQAREIWNRLLDEEQSAFPWLEAIGLERAYGDVANARRLFYKALDAVGYRADELFTRFVQFEREEGSREELDAALERVNARAAEHNARMKQQQYRKEKMQKIRGGGGGGGGAEDGEKRGRGGDRQKKMEQGKKKMEQDRKKQQEQHRQLKKTAAVAKQNGTDEEEQNEERRQHRTSAGLEEEEADEDDSDEEDEQMMDADDEAEAAKTATFETSAVPLGPMIPGMTMPPSAQPEVKKEEKPEGKKEEKRDDEEGKKPIMKKEGGEKRKREPSGTSEDGRSGGASAFPYATGLEKNKLFVKKLHWASTGEELKTFFEQFGAVRDARVVRKQNGRSKGCAYVEFADEQGCGAALMGADGAELRGRKIAVFLSNPPAKKPRMDDVQQGQEGAESTAPKPSSSSAPGAIEPQKPPPQPRKMLAPSAFAPRAAVLAGGARAGGRGGRLALPGASISKNANAAPSPVGVIARSTGEMSLEQEQQQKREKEGEQSQQ